MQFSDQVKQIAKEHNLNFSVCELCGYDGFAVRPTTRWKKGESGEVCYKNIIFICPNCRDDMGSKRGEIFKQLRG